MTLPVLHTLSRADGSATYTSPTKYTILCAVNAPVEVQRRDELPEEAFIEVNIRPHNGVGQVKERQLEKLLADTLRSVMLVEQFPRQMVQVTLQVLSVPEDEDVISRTGGPGENYLPILSSLINAACLALLDAAVPMIGTFIATTMAVTREGSFVQDPGVKDIKRARSLHVLAFSSWGELLLAECEGRFSLNQWNQVNAMGIESCFGHDAKESDIDMLNQNQGARERKLHEILKGSIERQVTENNKWRGD